MRTKLKKHSEIWWALATTALAFLAGWLGVTSSLKAQIEKLSQPITIQANQGVFWLGQRLAILSDRATNRRRIEELEQAYSQSLAELAQLKSLQAENQELRRLLELGPAVTDRAIASTIIAYGQPSLNLGSEAGLEVGQPVLAVDSLVGLVSQTSPHQSQVVLLAQNRGQPLLAKTEAGVTGLVIGDGGRVLLTEIPKTASLTAGELVVTSGQTGIKSDLVIGRILRLIDEPTAPTQEAVLETPVSFYDVSVVEVLL